MIKLHTAQVEVVKTAPKDGSKHHQVLHNAIHAKVDNTKIKMDKVLVYLAIMVDMKLNRCQQVAHIVLMDIFKEYLENHFVIIVAMISTIQFRVQKLVHCAHWVTTRQEILVTREISASIALWAVNAMDQVLLQSVLLGNTKAHVVIQCA